MKNMEILAEKNNNIDVFTAYFKPGCRLTKLQLNCQLIPNYNNRNLVPNNKTWSGPVKKKKKKLSVPNNKNLVHNDKNVVPNNN